MWDIIQGELCVGSYTGRILWGSYRIYTVRYPIHGEYCRGSYRVSGGSCTGLILWLIHFKILECESSWGSYRVNTLGDLTG